MGICGLDKAFAWLGSSLGSPITRPVEKRVVKAKAKCPKCEEEFEVEIIIEQKVAGSINGFTAFSGSGSILDQCPWTKK